MSASIYSSDAETNTQRLDMALAYLREHTEVDCVVFDLEFDTSARAAALTRDGELWIDGVLFGHSIPVSR